MKIKRKSNKRQTGRKSVLTSLTAKGLIALICKVERKTENVIAKWAKHKHFIKNNVPKALSYEQKLSSTDKHSV